jgi:hypothetical protein
MSKKKIYFKKKVLIFIILIRLVYFRDYHTLV